MFVLELNIRERSSLISVIEEKIRNNEDLLKEYKNRSIKGHIIKVVEEEITDLKEILYKLN